MTAKRVDPVEVLAASFFVGLDHDCYADPQASLVELVRTAIEADRVERRGASIPVVGLHYPTALDVLRLAVEAHLDVATSMEHDVADWCESVGPLCVALDEIRAGLGMPAYDEEEEQG